MGFATPLNMLCQAGCLVYTEFLSSEKLVLIKKNQFPFFKSSTTLSIVCHCASFCFALYGLLLISHANEIFNQLSSVCLAFPSRSAFRRNERTNNHQPHSHFDPNAILVRLYIKAKLSPYLFSGPISFFDECEQQANHLKRMFPFVLSNTALKNESNNFFFSRFSSIDAIRVPKRPNCEAKQNITIYS